MPTLRQLEVFIEAAGDCSFRVTADRLGISQPAISSQIKALEHDLGYALFIRRQGRNPILTGQAIELLPRAKEVLEKSRAFVPVSHRDRRPGKISLVASIRNFLLDTKLKPLLPDFLSAHPEIDLEIRQAESTRDLFDAFNSGQCDIAIYRGTFLPNVQGRVEILSHANVTLYASRPIAESLESGELTMETVPFVLPRQDTEVFRLLGQALEAAGIVPRQIAGYTQFPEVLAEWVIEGRGISPLFEDHLKREIESGKVRAISAPIYRVDTVMVLRNHALRPEAAPFLDLVRSALA